MADDFMAEYQARREKEQQQARDDIAKSCAVLERLGVKQVSVEYDGAGDEGAIENISFNPPLPTGIPDGLTQVLENAVYEFLPSGWEINDGSYGTLVIDVVARKIRQDHNWRVTEIESEENEFDL